MLTAQGLGIALAFGPGVVVILVPRLLGITIPTGFALSLAVISLPIFPISYTYAIYKRQLGQLEFRANRLLGLYGFILVYPTIFIVVLLFGEHRQPDRGAEKRSVQAWYSSNALRGQWIHLHLR